MSLRLTDDSDPWVIDYVLDERHRLRAVARARPGRGSLPCIRRVLEEAIASPRVGRPHLPANLEVTAEELGREIDALGLPLRWAMTREPAGSPTSSMDARARSQLEGYLRPDGHWRWLQPGVGAPLVDHLFELCYRLSTSFAWYRLTGREAVAVHLPNARRTFWLRLVTRRRLDHQLDVELHLAPDWETLGAWRCGELGRDTIVVACVDQDELPLEAWEECCRLGRQGSVFCPAITVGPRRRMARPTELMLALDGMMALCALFDETESPASEELHILTLASGEEARVEVLEPDLLRFPLNDGGLDEPGRAAGQRATSVAA